MVLPKGEGSTYTYSGISMLSPELFSTKQSDKFELWEEILLPASRDGLVSGEIYDGLLNNAILSILKFAAISKLTVNFLFLQILLTSRSFI